RTLEQEVAQIDSPETAEAVVRRAERLAGDATEQQKAQEAAADAGSAAAAVERAAAETPPRDEAAAVLVTAAAQAVGPTPEAPATVHRRCARAGRGQAPRELVVSQRAHRVVVRRGVGAEHHLAAARAALLRARVGGRL